MKKILILLLCGIVLVALICGAMFVAKEEEAPVENAGTAQNAAVKMTSLAYKGKEYPMKEKIQTVLFIGTDSTEGYQEEEKLQDYYNFNQADFLLLLVLDNNANTAEMIQLNRDTMTEVPWLDVLGNYGGTEYKQLCLAFNYGDGGMKSCKNTVTAVSELLFDAPIQNYIQIPMSAIGLLNDLVGGVPVTITEDLTVIDPAFSKGTTVRLTGSQAEKFLRARMTLSDDTNLSRMRRHRDYMDSFQACAKDAFDADSQFAMKLVEKLSEHLQSNMTAQQLSELVERIDGAEVSPIRYAEGKLTRGEKYYEFYADEASLWEAVKAAYCG